MPITAESGVTLVCCRCGKKSDPMTGGSIQFSIDLIPYADKAGFLWREDLRRSRALIFCSDQCEQSAKTKQGFYKSNPSKG